MGNLRTVVGQKRHLGDKDYEAIEAAASWGRWTNGDIAKVLRMSEEYLRRLKKENPLIGEAISRGKAACKDDLMAGLMQDAKKGDRDAAKWLLPRLFPSEFNYNVKRGSETNVDNRTVNLIQMPTALSESQYGELLQKLTPGEVIEQVPDGDTV